MNWCKIVGHRWQYYNRRIRIRKSDIIRLNGRRLTVPMRECKRCSKKQHHLMSMCNGIRYDWKDWKFK